MSAICRLLIAEVKCLRRRTGSWCLCATSIPILGTSLRFYGVRDRDYVDDSEYSFSGFTRVTPDFFDLIDVPVVAGRGFLPTDVISNRRVTIVDQRFAELNC